MFSVRETDAAALFHREAGFVCFDDLLSTREISDLTTAVDEGLETGVLKISDQTLTSNNDIVFLRPEFMALCKDMRIINIVRQLIGRPVALQHAKFNAKPNAESGSGEVPWHQDYPFYPHTNFDLVSCVVHVDEETVESGALQFIYGSHKHGPKTHLRNDGAFAYECTNLGSSLCQPRISLSGSAGFVSFHHCLTLHRSPRKSQRAPRRIIVFQYRAIDAVQIAGVLWKCNGLEVDDETDKPAVARFPDGTQVELRGRGGRLYDVAGRLAPDHS
jgi:hypothetical protein